MSKKKWTASVPHRYPLSRKWDAADRRQREAPSAAPSFVNSIDPTAHQYSIECHLTRSSHTSNIFHMDRGVCMASDAPEGLQRHSGTKDPISCGAPIRAHDIPCDAPKLICCVRRTFRMTPALLCIVITGVVVAMAARLRRRKLPAETVLLLSLLESLQASPSAADPEDSDSA